MAVVTESTDFDKVLLGLGTTGRYQICQYMWLFLSLFSVTTGFLGYVFTGKLVAHQCAPLSDDSFSDVLASIGIPPADVISNSTTLNECSIDVSVTTATVTETTTVECVDGDDFGALRLTSVVSEFSLVCETAVSARLPQFFFLVSSGVGGIVIPIVADRVGRKPLLILSHSMTLLLALTLAFPRDIVLYTVLKAVSGAFVEGVMLCAVTMAVELTSVKDRKLISVFLIVAWSVGGLSLCGLAFGLKDGSWRILQYALAAMSIVVFFQIFFIEESIRWLLAVNKNKEATDLITLAADMNEVDLKTVLPGEEETGEVENTSEADPKDPASVVVVSEVDTEHTSGINEKPPTETTGLGSVEKPPSETPTAENRSESIPGGDENPSGPSNSEGVEVSADTNSEDSNQPPGTEESTESTSEDSGQPPGTDDTDENRDVTTNGSGDAPVMAVAPIPVGTTDEVDSDEKEEHVSSGDRIIGANHCCKFGTSPRILSNMFIFIYIWFVTGFSYYALYFTTTFSEDIYLSFVVNVLSELPVAIVIAFGVDTLGRKKILYIFLGVAVVFLAVTSVITAFAEPDLKKILLPIFGLFGKFGVAGVFFHIFLYTGETFPTTLRLIGLGTASVASRIGSLGAPFIVFVDDGFSWLPTAVIALLLFVAIFAAIPLPETKGRELPQTMEDVDKLYEK